MEEVVDVPLSTFPDFVSFPVVVSILVVAGSSIGTVLLYIRSRRIAEAKARRHFVKAASLLSAAQQKSQSPAEAKVLAEQAIAEADLAIGINSDDAAYHIVKSLALEAAGKSGAAIKELTDALSRPNSLTIPERSNTLAKKAALLSESGNLQEALVDLEESVALTPTNPRVQLLLGEAYEKDGNVDKAVEAFNKAALLDPKSPDAKEALRRLQS